MIYVLFGFSLLMSLLCLGHASRKEAPRFNIVFFMIMSFAFALVAASILVNGGFYKC